MRPHRTYSAASQVHTCQRQPSPKVGITGASAFIRRMYEAGGNFQWARELLMNSIEADANRVEFGLEWNAVEAAGIYRRVVADTPMHSGVVTSL